MPKVISLQVSADHPAFRGHFPGRPIVPGVLLLQWAIDAIAMAEQRALLPGKLSVAKFLSPVGPAEYLELRYRSADTTANTNSNNTNAISFEIVGAGRKIATGTFLPTGAAL